MVANLLDTDLAARAKVVIDNATFHKGGRIEELVLAVGCEVAPLASVFTRP
jgi:hypothetical protein